MSINLTDELEAKTKKGKLGSAKQIFLEGDAQTVEKEIQDINSRHNDLSSTVSEHTKQIESNQSQITANKSAQDEKNASLDANMAKLNTRDDQITELVKGVTATGGASVATAVTYDNTSSQLVSATVQGAVDELQSSKIDKTSISQESGEAENKVMSQKAVSTILNAAKATAFTNMYKDGERNNIEDTGVYVNHGTNPAILFVRVEDTDNKIWQYEITTVNIGSPQVRIRYKEVGSGWNAWVAINSLYKFLQEYQDGYVTTSKLEETTSKLKETTSKLEVTTSKLEETTSKLEEIDRFYFHKFILKQGWINVNGLINNTEFEGCYSFLLGVKEGDVIGYTNGYQYAFFTKDIEFVNDSLAPLVDGTKRITILNKDDITIPATCKYLWISGHYQDSISKDIDYLPETITINGVTYNIKDGKDATIPNLVDKVNALEEKTKEIYPKGVLKYSASNKYFQFFMYRGTSNLYFSITMTLKTDNSDEVYLNEYRWTDGGLYYYVNGIFERVASTIINGENEMAMKFNNSIDYTGGLHGDERIDIDPNSFAHFFADGTLISEERLSKDFTIECSEFSYIQYSTLHETKGITSKEDGEHPIIAHHLKHNIFKDCASFLDNTVKFDIKDYDYSNLKVDQYHATIACVAKGGATTTLLPDFVVVDTSKGTNNSTYANNSNNAKTIQWNDTTGIKVLTEGHFTEGLSDDMKNNLSGVTAFVVWDRANDSKIYRRYHSLNKAITKGYTLRNHQEIHFS